MKLDISAAPEIAVLTLPASTVAGPAVPGTAVAGGVWPGGLAPGGPAGPAVPATVGYLAACLRILVADPQSWWDRVRFDPRRPVHIAVDAPSPRCAAWLLVLPPGYQGETWDWAVACLVAGEAAEQTGLPDEGRTRPLSAGRTRVRGSGGPYRMINTGGGYAVSLHARSAPTHAG
jgi:hypothetical protein